MATEKLAQASHHQHPHLKAVASNPLRGSTSGTGGGRPITLHRSAWTDEIERRLRDDRPVHLDIEELRLIRRDEAEADADWRIIGWGLAAGYAFVCIARLAQVLS